jgi:hypothetical protein
MAEKTDSKEYEAKLQNMSNIQKIISTICPDRYCSNAEEVKKLLKEKKFWQAVTIAKPGVPEYSTRAFGRQFVLSYNCPYETLEPIYFWILDFLGGESRVDKLVDNFISSPTSGHFAEQMGRATRMQEEGMKIMQTIGVLIKSVLNLIYDLRQFKQRLKDYEDAKSSDKDKKIGAIYSLKQIWMDNVDVKRGNTSIKGMAFSQSGFATLIDAFMIAEKMENGKMINLDGKELDLNDRVMRIVEQRMQEFLSWKELSENEMQKRYNIEKAYLKSQVDSIKLYSRWAKPYLKTAEELMMNASPNSAMVKAFNTTLLELVLFKKDEIKIKEEVLAGRLPKGFDKLFENGKIKSMNSCLLIELKFRGIPQRSEQHYTFGGKADVTFTAFALSKEEIKMLNKKLEESDLKDALKLVSGATEDSLKEIEKDIAEFLEDKKEEKEEKNEKKESDINPFSALIGIGSKEEKKEVKSKKEDSEILPDNYADKVVRNLAEFSAKEICFKVYDIYKKAHGMASIPIGDLLELESVGVSAKDIFKK